LHHAGMRKLQSFRYLASGHWYCHADKNSTSIRRLNQYLTNATILCRVLSMAGNVLAKQFAPAMLNHPGAKTSPAQAEDFAALVDRLLTGGPSRRCSRPSTSRNRRWGPIRQPGLRSQSRLPERTHTLPPYPAAVDDFYRWQELRPSQTPKKKGTMPTRFIVGVPGRISRPVEPFVSGFLKALLKFETGALARRRTDFVVVKPPSNQWNVPANLWGREYTTR
jgi:hypothetical protein